MSERTPAGERAGARGRLSRPDGRAAGRRLRARPRLAARDGLIAFLGSTIGNLYPEERARFLAPTIRSDALLLSLDLVKDAGAARGRLRRRRRRDRARSPATRSTTRTASSARTSTRRSSRTRRAGIPSTSGWTSASAPAAAHDVAIPALELDLALRRGRAAAHRGQLQVPPRADRAGARGGRASGSMPGGPTPAGTLRSLGSFRDRRRAKFTPSERRRMSAGSSICSHLDQIEVTELPEHDRGLRGVPEDRERLGASAHVHDLREDRLLRLLPEQARDRTLHTRAAIRSSARPSPARTGAGATSTKSRSRSPHGRPPDATSRGAGAP